MLCMKYQVMGLFALVSEITYALLADIEVELIEQQKIKNHNSFLEMYTICSLV